MGIFAIITKERSSMYACLLDFYFAKLSKEEQLQHFELYYDLRDKIPGLEHNRQIDIMYDMFKELQAKRNHTMHLTDEYSQDHETIVVEA
ncbi:MAG: hypothetical protein K6G84_12625 [Lachnospiraceae bacterium]|nr:hypothetical protein [Lachnospiraceae bacterium]